MPPHSSQLGKRSPALKRRRHVLPIKVRLPSSHNFCHSFMSFCPVKRIGITRRRRSRRPPAHVRRRAGPAAAVRARPAHARHGRDRVDTNGIDCDRCTSPRIHGRARADRWARSLRDVPACHALQRLGAAEVRVLLLGELQDDSARDRVVLCIPFLVTPRANAQYARYRGTAWPCGPHRSSMMPSAAIRHPEPRQIAARRADIVVDGEPGADTPEDPDATRTAQQKDDRVHVLAPQGTPNFSAQIGP